MAQIMSSSVSLYRHFDCEDRLLYVGISLSAIARLAQHRNSSGWFSKIAKVTIEKYPSREAAAGAEREAIRKEQPLFNRAHNEPRSLLALATSLALLDDADAVEIAISLGQEEIAITIPRQRAVPQNVAEEETDLV